MSISYKFSKLAKGIIFFCIMIIIRDILKLPIPEIGIFVGAVLVMGYLKYKDLMSFVFFLFPIFCGIPGYIALVSYLFLIFKGPSVRLNQIMPVILIMLLELFNQGVDADNYIITGMISFLSFSALFFYILNVKKAYIDVKTCVHCFVLGCVFTFLVIFYNMFQQYDINYVLSGAVRTGALGIEDNNIEEMRGHLAMNANTIAYYAIATISLLVIMMHTHKMQKIDLLLICSLIVAGLLTFSRTFMLTLVSFLCIYVLFTGFKSKLKFLAFGCIVVIAILLFAQDLFDEIMNSFLNRREESNIATAGGRTILFEEYNTKWIESIKYILIGCGVVDYIKTLDGSNAIHSGLQQIWVCLGLSGLLIYIEQIGFYIIHRFQKKNLILLLPFIFTFIFDQSIQFLNPYPLMMPVVATLIIYDRIPKKRQQ